MKAMTWAVLILCASACGGAPRPSGIRYEPQPTPTCGVVRPYELPEKGAEGASRAEPRPAQDGDGGDS
jgi:hypothetical protein